MLTLARRTTALRKQNELAGNKDAQILESTQALVNQQGPIDNSEDLYIGAELRDFAKERWDIPSLNTETVSRILKRHNVLEGTKRPRIEIRRGGRVMKVQKVCYILDRERLSNLTRDYFDGGERL
jgi:hypothetical protein